MFISCPDFTMSAADNISVTGKISAEKNLPAAPCSTDLFLTEFDLHLLCEGTHWKCYDKLGAHLREVNGKKGVNFAVWAPNASAVSVVGEFNQWNGEADPMINNRSSGFWEVFIPDVQEWATYKYRVRNGGDVFEKSDPIGFYAEVPPCTASKVVDLNRYQWDDAEYLEKRRRVENDWLNKPMSIYEVHLGSWRRPADNPYRWLSYRDIADQIVKYVTEMGYTHIELLPVAEHPLSASWGYQVVGYFAVTSRYGSPEDFMYLVDKCHQSGIGVIVDWVPAHFPKDGHGLRCFDGTALYEHSDPRQGEHRDWGTLIFNYGRNEVRNFLISNAIFWLDKYHIDGLRVDAVASMLYLDYSRKAGDWIPNEFGGRENIKAIDFIKMLNVEVGTQYPNVLTIAEESTAWAGVSRPTYLGGLGFSMKWNMGWMNDTLRYMRHDPIHRKFHHDELTFSLIYAFHENFILPLSHDEVVHGKGSILDQVPGDLWQKFANARLLYSYMWTHPGKKLTMMGDEFGQWNEWNFDESLQWHLLQWEPHQGLQRCIADLNKMYCNEPALYEYDFDGRGFEWIDCRNWETSTFAFIRKAKEWSDHLVVICNFTPVPRTMRLGVPMKCYYEEIFSSDSEYYGGGNTGNGPGVTATDDASHGHPFSIEAYFPPLGISVLKPRF
ncbi:MAG: 1,4-alpha-glucan branching protein GlgB [Planctomycetaceae bacterium]|jgi:1,4-alpha-glucan branching enzyme|nr:1,4-alpha-glucan branching protein GlgB [Planctomycetaceae bacterium]